MRRRGQGSFDLDLGCEVFEFTVDLVMHNARIWVPQGDLPDRDATVQFFEGIDPEMKDIRIVGGRYVSAFLYVDGGEWRSANVADLNAARKKALAEEEAKASPLQRDYE